MGKMLELGGLTLYALILKAKQQANPQLKT